MVGDLLAPKGPCLLKKRTTSLSGVNGIFPEEERGEEPGGSRAWWEIPAVPAAAYEEQPGKSEGDFVFHGPFFGATIEVIKM